MIDGPKEKKIKLLLAKYRYQTLVSGLHSVPVKDSDDLVTAFKVTRSIIATNHR